MGAQPFAFSLRQGTMGERVFVRQAGTFQFRHMRAKLVGELCGSTSLRNVARQESDIRKTILSIPSFGLRGKPFPVHFREVEWKPGQRLCDPSIEIFAVEREEKQFGWIKQLLALQVSKTGISQLAQSSFEELFSSVYGWPVLYGPSRGR